MKTVCAPWEIWQNLRHRSLKNFPVLFWASWVGPGKAIQYSSGRSILKKSNKLYNYVIWIPVLAGIGLLVASCSTSPEDRLSSLVPGLPISSRTTLLNSSGEELREYYETEGHSRVSEDFYWILQAFWNAAQEDREFLLPLMGRLGRVRDDLFKVPYGTKVAQDLASRSPETLDRIFSLEQEWDRLRSDSMTPDAEKIVQLLDIVEELEKMGYVPLQVASAALFKVY